MKRRHYLAASVISIILLAGASLGVYFSQKPSKTAPTAQDIPNPTSNSQHRTSKLAGSYLVSGDVFWGRGIDYYARQTTLKYDWPFSGLKQFHPGRYDGWISDLECPVTNRVIPYQVQVDKLLLQCSPAYLDSAAKYFTAFTLANNHSSNAGAAGFADTRTNLTQAGVQFFGHHDLSQKTDLCEVVSLPARLDKRQANLPIAMCGYHWLDREPSDNELAEISRYAKYFPVWVFPHGGTEYATHHSPEQQALYRRMIDLGADAVFGDHPHVVQDTEAYKGKLIVYNLGNLIYDQWFDNEVTKSLIVNVQVSAQSDDNLNTYLAMAKDCQRFKDDCLKTAQKRGLTAAKLTYKYKILAGDSSNDNLTTRVKRPASPAVYQWLLERTNWSGTSRNLN